MTEPPDALPVIEEMAETSEPKPLAGAVRAGFSRKFRDRITVEQIDEILGTLDLSENRPTRLTPLLRLLRLRFTGEKRLRLEDDPHPIDYDQVFQPGVNVLLIEDNDVGKSSIMKTIKFALTGDDSDYDLDVKGWIREIWLTFSLDTQVFTIVLSAGDVPRATMVLGETTEPIAKALVSPTYLWDAIGGDRIKEELQRFFFGRLALSELSWTVQASDTAPILTPATTWLTYFQVLEIVDDRYLLCDPAHSYGNQEGLIFSTFLGLRMTEPLNRLGVEMQRTRKQQKTDQTEIAEDVRRVEEEATRLETHIAELRAELAAIDAVQRQRRQAMRGSPPATRLVEVQTTMTTYSIERGRLIEEREDLGRRVRHTRAEARRLREAVRLRLHFTGLTVNVCPSCDNEVDDSSKRREEEEHLCRLCGRTPHSAPANEITAMEIQALAADGLASEIDRDRTALNARVHVLDREIESLTIDAAVLQEAAERGVDAALPTIEEDAERIRLAEQIGDLNAQIRLLRLRTDSREPNDEAAEMRWRVLEKARDLLKDQAQSLNTDTLARLSALTQDVSQRIGADSIGDVTVLPLGEVQFSKNGVRVRFGTLHNPGDRLRVKLAFFLAMMRLGREPGLGRHPGLLLIDQPGGAEMVAQDFTELAKVFHEIDHRFAGETQILCFTAGPEFAAATDASKIYGPQGANGTAF